jgi:3-hydroxyacyl-CoA dehydrogenase/enoyl-CoA hydratase/3-hydroxybutyryl-CoA epimerase
MRIAIEGARFGFPEIMLGLHPGLGGTARSPNSSIQCRR